MSWRGVALSVLLGVAAAVKASPDLSGEASRPECVDALTLAKSIFASSAKHLYVPLQIPEAWHSHPVLGATEPDISAGDALQATDDFEKIPQAIRSVYWARQAQHGRRLVVTETARGWRGDTYSVHMLDEPVRPDDFMRSGGAEPIIDSAWRPPAVFRSSLTGALWLIDVGQPFDIWPAWRVFVPPERTPVCRVQFRDPLKDPAEFLPEAVRALLPFLDEAIGPGLDEGTLQQTARLRLHVRHVLANAALRPWAVSEADAYNTRETVNAGLEAWALQSPEQAEMHRTLRAGQPGAEQALAGYYATRFALPVGQADALAAWMLDIVFRAHFVFPRSVASQVPGSPNPWATGPAERTH